MFSAEHMLDLLIMGWISNIPLAIGSIITLTVFFERLMKLRGLATRSRVFATEVIDTLAKPDLEGALRLCMESDLPIARMLREALRWQNVSLDDYEKIQATVRAELGAEMKRGIWMIGTVGSLAPFVGLFGTVVGIIRAFAVMAEAGGGGFAVVANSLSEALIATAAGLGVAIIALLFYNYLNSSIASINQVLARASERMVQALLYLETSREGSAATGGGGD